MIEKVRLPFLRKTAACPSRDSSNFLHAAWKHAG